MAVRERGYLEGVDDERDELHRREGQLRAWSKESGQKRVVKRKWSKSKMCVWKGGQGGRGGGREGGRERKRREPWPT